MTSWSRRDQNQAYQFITRRIVSAVLSGEPETSELPMRRFTVTLLASAGVALLVVAGFVVYGLIFPGGGRPPENVIILERETGASYLYLQGRLHPVLNWTSARLILGQPEPPVQTMSRTSLRDVPRGRAVGIRGLPDSLPDKGSLIRLPWSVCSAPRSPTSVELATHVLAGRVPDGGAPLADNEGVLVTLDNERFLVWHDHRLRIANNAVVTTLGWAGVRPAPVSRAFLDALPPGPDLAPPRVENAGARATPVVGGAATTIGQLFRANGKHYVMLRDGLTPVGDLTAQLLVAGGQRIIDASAPEVGRILVNTPIEPPGMPEQVPAAHGADDRFAMACAVYRGATEIERPVTVESFARVDSELAQSVPAAAGTGPGEAALADRVLLAGGHGALAAALMPAGSTATGIVYVVTDQGVKYPLPAGSVSAVQANLGYAGVVPVTVPASVLALIPTGPALDPAAATIFTGPEIDATPGPTARSG